MDFYLWLKALHIAAAVTWISGMLATGLAVASIAARTEIQTAHDPRFLDATRRWDRHVTLPAMLLVWGLGITMAMRAGWFSSTWLMIKLAIVVALSALHGLLSGTLRRFGHGADRRLPAVLRYAAPATIIGVVLIALLAVTKPY
jgi:putative membrane protein